MDGGPQSWRDIVTRRVTPGPFRQVASLRLELGDETLRSLRIVFGDVEADRHEVFPRRGCEDEPLHSRAARRAAIIRRSSAKTSVAGMAAPLSSPIFTASRSASRSRSSS